MRKCTWKIMVALLMVAAVFAGCSKTAVQMYRVDYRGSEYLYRGAKDSYPAGQTVTLYYDLIATDTDYAFYLDEEPLDVLYEDDGFKITFVMPEHDVTLRCETRNSMEYIPSVEIPEESGLMMLDYCEAVSGTEEGQGYTEYVVYTTDDPLTLLLQYYEVDEQGEQTLTQYHVSYHAVDICYTHIENYDMRNWEIMDDTISMDGMVRTCQFYDDGEYIRVSTDEMPEYGETGLDLIRMTLQDYMTEGNRIAE